MNQEKMPRHVAEPESTTMSQMLSWISGQWYRGRTSRRTIAIVEGLVLVCRDYQGAVFSQYVVEISRGSMSRSVWLRAVIYDSGNAPSAQLLALWCRVVESDAT